MYKVLYDRLKGGGVLRLVWTQRYQRIYVLLCVVDEVKVVSVSASQVPRRPKCLLKVSGKRGKCPSCVRH